MFPKDRPLIHRDELDQTLKGDPFQYAAQTGREKLEQRFKDFAASLPHDDHGKVDSQLLVDRQCPACAGPDSRVAFVKYGFPIHRCASCDFLFARPVLDQSRHPSMELEIGGLSQEHLAFITSPFYVACAAKRVEFEIQRAIMAHGGQPKHLLEIGCSVGTGLRIATEYGLKPAGVEPNVAAAALARDAGFEVIHDLFTADLFPDQRFDLILHMDVLEHVQEPRAFMADVRRLLAPDGVVLVQVPNAGALISLVEWADNQIFNGLIHLNYFDPKSLDAMAQSVGLEVVETFSILSELGKLKHVDPKVIQRVVREHRPQHADHFKLHQDDINDAGLGYKIIGIYRNPG